jgi:molybdopterin-guanine dinucleotide biosynthesis protein B
VRLPKAVCIIGHQNSGKTRLVAALVKRLTRRGFRVGTLKHAKHGFLADTPGKDSHVHFNAGAAVTMLAAPDKVAVFRRVKREPRLKDLLAGFDGVDFVIVEGYRTSTLPKIEVYRRAVAPRPMSRSHRIRVAATVSDDLDGALRTRDIDGIADAVLALVGP